MTTQDEVRTIFETWDKKDLIDYIVRGMEQPELEEFVEENSE